MAHDTETAAAQTAEGANGAAAQDDANEGNRTETRVLLASACDDRAALYGFIARLFATEVDDDLLVQLRENLYRVNGPNEHVNKGNRLIATYLSYAWDWCKEELAQDYVRTFVGHGTDGHSAAYPYESVFTANKRLLMQGARDEVLALYRSEGLDKSSTWILSEDHITVELEFMQALSARTADALRAGDEHEAERLFKVQEAFLADHLEAWVSLLAGEMRMFSNTDFYRGLAYLSEGHVESDARFVRDVLAEPEAE